MERWLGKIDKFLLLLITVVLLATFFPSTGHAKIFFEYLTDIVIALLFFMHGAKLSRSDIQGGIRHWRLHLVVLTTTFIVFPLLALSMAFLEPYPIPHVTYLGFLFLAALPATVQSAIALTSIAGGNVAAAICSAALSSVLGVFLSPVLVGFLLHAQGEGLHNPLDAIGAIMFKLLLPFVIGHCARPLLIGWLTRYRKVIGRTDRSAILLVVYVAFSDAVINGIWQQVSFVNIIIIILCSLGLLGTVIVMTTWSARFLGFSREDEITIVFCGSKKSLANGIPMANVMFPAASVGLMVLPLMIFHQLQLMVCSVLARHYAGQLLKTEGVSDT